MEPKKIKVGIAGGRSTAFIMGLQDIPGVEISAICELDTPLMHKVGDQLNIAQNRRYRVFEDMMDADIDAVIIATPMQCHVPQALMALEAGMHVMSEVTAGVTMDELWWLIESVEKSGKTYMMAENYMYMPQVQIINEMVKKGMFGECYYAEGAYIHNLDGLFRYGEGNFHCGKASWRSYWQCGKRGNFYPTHALGPVMQWFPGDHIKEISCFSPGVYVDNGIGLKQDSGTTTMCRLDSGKLVQIRTDCMSPRPHNGTYYHLQGTKGVYQSTTGYNDPERVSFLSETNVRGCMFWEPLDNYKDFLPERYKNATEEQKAAGHNGGDFFIVADFINAIRTGEKPAIDVYEACEWTAMGLLSELSVMNNGRTMEMPRFRKNMTVEDKKIKL